MDTMLGLDNTGHVNKNYYDEDTDPGVFNGDEVLWDFVRDALPQEVAQFYSRAEQANGILTKNGILPFFNSNQANMANETFYNEDAFYKYIDTFRTGYTDHLNDKFIAPGTGERLYAAQGSRSMMREYFIENRIKYLRGKYSSTGYQSGDRIEFRVNYPKDGEGESEEEKAKFRASIAAVPPSGDFHFTSLKTGFAGVKIGQNGVPVNRRFVDEQDITISVDTSGANGTEAYLLGISNLSSIGDVSDKYLQNLIVGASDNRLKSLIMGNHHKDYYNPYWKGVNNIGLNGFTYLEEFNLENCASFTGALDFTDCAQIKKILLNGSGSTTLVLPPSGVIQELRIPTSINNFAIDSHPTLAADKFTIGHFDYTQNAYVNDYTRLAHVSIKNTPIDSYGLVRGAVLVPAQTRLESYCFQGVNWEITEVSDVTIENGAITAINILDRLHEDLVPYDGVSSHAEALTGNLVVNVGNYTVNEYALYNKYYKIYPNLKITYISTGLQGASTIKFYNSETIMGEPYYTVLTDGTATLDFLISAEGPNGVALTTPIKVADNRFTYAFNGKWTVAETASGSIFTKDAKINQTDFANYTPNRDTSFTANFDSSQRMYKVTLYDDDGETPILEEQLGWEADIGVALAHYSQLSYNYKPYDKEDSNPHGRYTFKGWQSGYDYTSNSRTPTWTTLEGRKIAGDFVAYACYEEEDARYVATDEKYFTFTTAFPSLVEYSNPSLESGWKISMPQLYRDNFQGKLTLPSKYKDTYISYVGNFNDLAKVTDVYFLEDNRYRGITDKGFNMEGNTGNMLKNVYLPTNGYMLFLDDNSFRNCFNLENISINGDGKLSDSIEYFGMYAFQSSTPNSKTLKVYINELPANTKKIRNSAFYGAGPNFVVTRLPEGVRELPNWCMAYDTGVQIGIFGTETPGTGLESIGMGSLYLGGNTELDVVLLQSVLYLSTNSSFPAFSDYKMKTFSAAGGRTAEDFYSYETKNDVNKVKLGSFAEAGVPDVQIVEAVQEVMV